MQNQAMFDATVRSRQTTKYLSTSPLPVHDIRGVVDELIELAGWAPFHRPCDTSHQSDSQLPGNVPWRMVALDAASCRVLREQLPADRAGKLPGMLASADALIQVTWLPNPAAGELADGQLFEPSLANMEHIAAASAAVQNLLLAATQRGIPNYWSSGGALLREPAVFAALGIPAQEILLASVFLFPSDAQGAEVVGSKLRKLRPSPAAWSRWASL